MLGSWIHKKKHLWWYNLLHSRLFCDKYQLEKICNDSIPNTQKTCEWGYYRSVCSFWHWEYNWFCKSTSWILRMNHIHIWLGSLPPNHALGYADNLTRRTACLITIFYPIRCSWYCCNFSVEYNDDNALSIYMYYYFAPCILFRIKDQLSHHQNTELFICYV